jgi:DNA-binding response OmpR family regulator
VNQDPKKRILVADDDADIASLLARVLGEHCDVVVAHDGPDALAKASEMPRPMLLLLDIMMPGLDGLSVAKQIRMLPGLASVPIIFLTARGAPMDTIRGIQAGARHYITKPFKLEELVSKVRKVLGS